MPTEQGNDMLLKIEDPLNPGTYIEVGSLKTTDMQFSTTSIDVTTQSSNEWRDILDNAGTRVVSISGNGVFTDSNAEVILRDNALNNTITNFEITFGNGSVLSGMFKIAAYARSGTEGNEEAYSITLQSSGAITFS